MSLLDNDPFNPEESVTFEATNITALSTYGSGQISGFFGYDTVLIGTGIAHEYIEVLNQTFGVVT